MDANRWRDHVMVVAHRAGWKEGGQEVRAENSKAAIDHAAAIGVEMVELDVRRTRDGALVVMHDATLERTTTCRGAVADFMLDALKACRLVVEGTGIVTDEPVPTLVDMLSHAKGRILVNIDNKLEPEDLVEIVATARGLGMADGILIKTPIWNDERLARARTVLDRIGPDVAFMPILADDAVRDAGFVDKVARAFGPSAAEMIHWHRQASEPLTGAGGPLFSAQSRAAAVRGNFHMWINTYQITDRPEGMVAGGRGDGLAFAGGDPQAVYGFWIDRGATIIQTDEPKAVIDWLARNGYRRGYGAGS
ncbi:glycerophosphoryl diester phosphodiesterase [Ciceribacter naphthalenivorans]|uniref:Glycerophosphoryl diester phosphodiesterase n=3 Tax=Pseudomonadota TaxID=1224 RepID=A0A512HDI3_9HYPH|nr:glycerophosphoryl diester phosphodiesterase [Ciceribacter naphthalenivorans]GLR24338.1 glycerophosphoryl diester phosphodiesterase [Ciceribacter naphthalenivorans]GLT07194.1 glycerophosphoryl diester phosphodiesterase [Sphingomonas psychrolutea]